MLAESVGLALLVVLDTLTPTERLAFVLHDMFAVPFAEIGGIIGRSTDATKMLASRARRKVQGTPRPEQEPRRQRAAVDAFLAAARHGDFEGLVRLLDPQVTWRTYHPQGVMTTVGAAEVAGPILRGIRSMTSVLPVRVNGEPGFVAWGAKGKVARRGGVHRGRRPDHRAPFRERPQAPRHHGSARATQLAHVCRMGLLRLGGGLRRSGASIRRRRRSRWKPGSTPWSTRSGRSGPSTLSRRTRSSPTRHCRRRCRSW